MRAAVFKEAGRPLVVETMDDPTPGEGEAIIKVQRCGICGTDLHMTSGHATDFPANSVLGHEFCGEIVALGKGVDTLKLGQRVTAMPVAGCGDCQACRSGFPMACADMEARFGGFGEYTRIAASSSVVLPDTLSTEDGALVEPLAVSLRGVRLAAIQPGARVAVLGSGAIGVAAIYWARRLGAGKIVAIDPAARRSELALQMGADGFEVLGEGEGERIGAVLGGMPDVVLECAGAVGAMQKSVELVGPNGTIVSLGFCGLPDPILPSLATWKQVTMKFSFAYDMREFRHSARTLEAGHVEPRQMISQTVGLDMLPDIFEALRAGTTEPKVHVEPWRP